MTSPSATPELQPTEKIQWRVELFGGLRVRRIDKAGAGFVLDSFRTQKTGALLAFLVLDRRLHPRELLAELMWPEHSPDLARNSLRVSLAWLRANLERKDRSGRVLRARREGIGVGDELFSDLDEFRSLIKRAELEKTEKARITALAAALHFVEGPLLRGFYEDWAVSAARRFETEFLAATHRVIAAREQEEDWLRALDCARHAAMIVPDSDSLMRDVVRLGLRAGESGGVKREFDAWRKRRESSGLSEPPLWKDFVGKLDLHPSTPPPSATPPAIAHPQRRASDLVPDAQPPRVQVPAAAAATERPTPQGAASSAPSLVLRPRPLPAASSSFVGRTLEREAISALLHAPGVRLVTILGAGGAGKTRLALEIARTAQGNGQFEAVAWVSAASLGTVRAVQNALFDALGIPLGGSAGSDLAALRRAVEQSALNQSPSSGARTLLVFDNFEHFGEAGALWISKLLECVPHVVLLVTSRLSLLVTGEHLWPLAPLPSARVRKETVSLETVASTRPANASASEATWPDAVRLFVERAALVRPGFSPAPSDVADIAHICEALGGSPLAIEIAAARLALFSPAQLVEELQRGRETKPSAPTMRRSGLLLERIQAEPPPASSGSPLDWPNRDITAPVRHRTLREAIEWSARQLPPPARAFWARASVFRGAFEVDAAREVCEEPNAATLLLSLRDSSLLRLHTEGDVARASWNDALREFAQGLLSPEDRARLEARHAAFFARRAREAGAIVGQGEGGRAFAGFGADGPPPSSLSERTRARVLVRHAREELDAARADVRAAFEWLLVRDAEAALDMAAHLWPAWAANKQLAEGRALLDRSLQAVPDIGKEAPEASVRPAWSQAWEVRARALEGAGALAAISFESQIARNFFESARRAFERAGDAEGVARCLSAGGMVAFQSGDLLAARALSEQSLSLENQSQNATRRNALFNLSLVAIMSGDFVSVRALASEGLSLHRAQNDRHGIALCLESLGQVALFEGEYPTARVYLEAARDQFHALGEDAGTVRIWWGLGHIARGENDFSTAYTCFVRAAQNSAALEHTWPLPYLLEAFALLAGDGADWVRATRLLTGAQRVRREEATPLPRPYFGAQLDQLHARCKGELGPARFEAERTVSEIMSREDLIALACS